MDSVNIDKLITILEDEINIFKQILDLSKEKTSVIVEGKINDLENMLSKEQSLVVKIGELESQRENITEDIKAQLNIDKDEFYLTTLTEYIDETKSCILKETQKEFTKVLDDLKETNQINSQLINNSLEYIDFSINLLSSEEVQANNYSDKGETKNKTGRNIFDLKL